MSALCFIAGVLLGMLLRFMAREFATGWVEARDRWRH
jgi:hypothetical protein